ESRILRELRARREPHDGIQVVDYRPRFRRDFARLNLKWIREHFSVEPDDRRVLSDPRRQIISKGGFVLFAVSGERVVGTCALKKLAQARFELCKMAVDESARGRGVGARLLSAAIDRARRAGAKELCLETHHSLAAAVHLYRKFGFEQIPVPRDTK